MKRSRAFRFLADCANLDSEDNAAYEQFRQRYPEIFRSLESPEAVRWIGTALRKAWEATTERQCEWYLAHAQSIILVETAPGRYWPPSPPPEPSALEQALLHFRQNISRALLCRNSECQTPYFIAREKGQKYCSENCSHFATLATKLRWWNANRAKNPQPNSQPKRRLKPSSDQPKSKPSAIRRKKGK